MALKNFQDCLAWLEQIKQWKASAPEGCKGIASDLKGVYILREVDPEALRGLLEFYGANATLSGTLEGEWCYVDLRYPFRVDHAHLDQKANRTYRFFYRKTSQ